LVGGVARLAQRGGEVGQADVVAPEIVRRGVVRRRDAAQVRNRLAPDLGGRGRPDARGRVEGGEDGLARERQVLAGGGARRGQGAVGNRRGAEALGDDGG